jgi:uncharacterized protein
MYGQMTATVLALLAGAVVGLSLGALGSGGSVLALPALVYLMGFSPDHATTASLLIVVATSMTTLLPHARTGTVRWRSGIPLAVAAAIPAATAGVLTHHSSAAALTAAFAAIATLAAAAILRTPHPTTGLGTSLLVITVSAAAALTPRLGELALLDWPLIGPFAAAALLAAWDGKRLAGKVEPITLHRIFAAALLATAAFMALDAARLALTGS